MQLMGTVLTVSVEHIIQKFVGLKPAIATDCVGQAFRWYNSGNDFALFCSVLGVSRNILKGLAGLF